MAEANITVDVLNMGKAIGLRDALAKLVACHDDNTRVGFVDPVRAAEAWVAARAALAQSEAQQSLRGLALDTLRDYVERSTHWKEGGATRHDALMALNALLPQSEAQPSVSAEPRDEWAAFLAWRDDYSRHSDPCAWPAWQARAALSQHAERQGEVAEMSPGFTDTSRAALLWVLWHHQGGGSPVGQPLRFALGMGAHDRLNEHQVREAKRWAAISKSSTADFHTSLLASPPPAQPDAYPALQALTEAVLTRADADKTADALQTTSAPYVPLSDMDISDAYVKWDRARGSSYADLCRAIERIVFERMGGKV